MRKAAAISTPPAAPRSPASATASGRAAPRCTRSSTSSPTRTRASSRPRSPRRSPTDLVADAPAGIGHVYFVSGGSEAIEAALKMARQYFVENGEPQRRNVIARRQSYHGNTLGALATGGNAWRRAQFEPLLFETHHIDRRASPTAAASQARASGLRARAAQALEDKILELGPRHRHRLRRRDRGRRDRRRGAAGRRLLQAHPRDLRPLRRAADPRRGDVRHGAHRHAARLRAGRHRARPDGHRQGTWRRLPADRRDAVEPEDFRRLRQRLGLLPARPHLSQPSDGLRGGARGAGSRAARQAARQRAGDGRAARAAAQRPLPQPRACRRHSRPRPVSGDRARR